MNYQGRITRRMLLMLVIGLICQTAFSQQVSVTSATRQGWAGGICCVHGVNYTVNVLVILNKNPITFDTLWTEGYCHDLAKYNSKALKQQDTLYIRFSEGLRIFDHQQIYTIDQQQEIIIPCYNTNKKGVLLQYKVNEKTYLLDITTYVTELESWAYPSKRKALSLWITPFLNQP